MSSRFNMKNLNKKNCVKLLLGVFLLAGSISVPIYAKINSDKGQISQPVQISGQVIPVENKQPEEIKKPEIKREINLVYYSQNDDRWREYKYSNYGEPTWRTVYEGGPQNIGRSGCLVTNSAMAFSSLTGRVITPPMIADYSVKNGYRTNDNGTILSLIPNLANYYGVNCTETYDLQQVIDTLKNDKNCVVLVTMSKTSHFTTHGHCLMLTAAETDNKNKNWFTAYDSNTYSRLNGKVITNNPNYTGALATKEIQLTGQVGIIKTTTNIVDKGRLSSYYILSKK